MNCLLLQKTRAVYNKLHISDQKFDVEYTLADIIVIGKVSYYRDQDDYEIEVRLEKEQMLNLIKAKQALADQDNMTIKSFKDIDRGLVCEFIFGDNASYSNKVSYKMEGKISDNNIELPFHSDLFRDILKVNSGMEYGILKVSREGLIKLNFYSDEILSEYYLLRRE